MVVKMACVKLLVNIKANCPLLASALATTDALWRCILSYWAIWHPDWRMYDKTYTAHNVWII